MIIRMTDVFDKINLPCEVDTQYMWDQTAIKKPRKHHPVEEHLILQGTMPENGFRPHLL